MTIKTTRAPLQLSGFPSDDATITQIHNGSHRHVAGCLSAWLEAERLAAIAKMCARDAMQEFTRATACAVLDGNLPDTVLRVDLATLRKVIGNPVE